MHACMTLMFIKNLILDNIIIVLYTTLAGTIDQSYSLHAAFTALLRGNLAICRSKLWYSYSVVKLVELVDGKTVY